MLKQFIRQGFIILFLMGISNILPAQTPSTKEEILLTPSQMHEDIDFFYKELLRIHPNPYQILKPEELKAEIQRIKGSINTPLNALEFWLKIGILNQYFDGHTRIHSPPILLNYKDSVVCMPSGTLFVVGDDLFFGEVGSLDSALHQKKIISINGIPSQEIVVLGKQYIPKELFVMESMQIQIMYIFSYVYAAKDSLVFVYEGDSDLVETLLFTKADERKAWDYYLKTSQKGKGYQFYIFPEDSVALFELNTCSLEKMQDKGGNYFQDLADFMDSISKIGVQHLFIDVSSNGGGGSGVGMLILHFLLDSGKVYNYSSTEYKISPEVKRAKIENYGTFRYYLSLFSNSYNRGFGLKRNGTYYQKEWSWYSGNLEPQYKNKVYLIQSKDTYSAAVDLSSFFKTYQVGTVFGEESGGLTSGYIESTTIQLKNSEIWVRFSMKYFENSGSLKDGRGVLPDIPYPMKNRKSGISLEELKEMLQLAKEKDIFESEQKEYND